MTARDIIARIEQRGHWGSRLAELWYYSDSGNRLLIEKTWLSIFQSYDPNFQPGQPE